MGEGGDGVGEEGEQTTDPLTFKLRKLPADPVPLPPCSATSRSTRSLSLSSGETGAVT